MILGRCTLGDTMKNKNEHMSDMYLLSNHLLHAKNDVLNEFDEIKEVGESHDCKAQQKPRRPFWRT